MNETLDHIPSSCLYVVVTMYMVKGRQYSAYTSITAMESETDSQMTSLDVSITVLQIGCVHACVLYTGIAQGGFIYAWDYVSQENA